MEPLTPENAELRELVKATLPAFQRMLEAEALVEAESMQRCGPRAAADAPDDQKAIFSE
jgi:hypothetical protein